MLYSTPSLSGHSTVIQQSLSQWSLYSYTVVPLLVATLQLYTNPSLSGHPLMWPVMNLCPYYCNCSYFSLSSKATYLQWPQYLGKQGGLIREGLLYKYPTQALFLSCSCKSIRGVTRGTGHAAVVAGGRAWLVVTVWTVDTVAGIRRVHFLTSNAWTQKILKIQSNLYIETIL